MKGDGFRLCRECGQPVKVITWGVYRNVLADATPVWVKAEENGFNFVRENGSKVIGKEVAPGTEGSEMAYRLHRQTCGRKA